MIRILLTAFIVTFASGNGFASVRYVLPNSDLDIKNKDINVYFFGGINNNKIIDLINAIDKFNIEYPKASAINLYINSYGGSMDAGWAGYGAIKSSKIPVKTINISSTNSSATLLYCAAEQRYVMSSATFLLHPAAKSFTEGDYKPNEVDRQAEFLKNMNKYFFKAYSECTSLKTDEIHKVLSAEQFSRIISDEEAVKLNISSQVISSYFPAAASAYIYDDNNSD